MKRTECVVCSSKKFELLYIFDNMPMYIGVSNQESNTDKFSDQSWYICKNCGCIQLLDLVDLHNLYSISHNPAIGKTWMMHNKDFSDYILKHGHDKILEIGGGSLNIANIIAINKKIKKYKIYDIHCNKSGSIPEIIEFNESFFDLNEDTMNVGTFNTIILSHTFEHLYDPVSHLIKFHDILPFGGKLIISVPNIENGIIDKFTNALNFEHSFYVEEDNLNYMIKKCGFKLINITHFSKHNIFAVYEKAKGYLSIALPKNYEKNEQIFCDFVDHHKKNLNYLNEQIEKNKDCDKYLFGSHIFSQFLISFGLNVKNFKGILDDDTSKQKHRLYGTELTTYESEVIKDLNKPFVILQAGIYSKEIADKLLKINSNTIIIF
jgi:hypothetical protein